MSRTRVDKLSPGDLVSLKCGCTLTCVAHEKFPIGGTYMTMFRVIKLCPQRYQPIQNVPGGFVYSCKLYGNRRVGAVIRYEQSKVVDRDEFVSALNQSFGGDDAVDGGR